MKYLLIIFSLCFTLNADDHPTKKSFFAWKNFVNKKQKKKKIVEAPKEKKQHQWLGNFGIKKLFHQKKKEKFGVKTPTTVSGVRGKSKVIEEDSEIDPKVEKKKKHQWLGNFGFKKFYHHQKKKGKEKFEVKTPTPVAGVRGKAGKPKTPRVTLKKEDLHKEEKTLDEKLVEATSEKPPVKKRTSTRFFSRFFNKVTNKIESVTPIMFKKPKDIEYIGTINSIERKRPKHTSFYRHGKYQLYSLYGNHKTGLPLPLSGGDVLETAKNRLDVIVESGARIVVDNDSLIQFEKIYEIYECTLMRGRIRIHLQEKSPRWIVHMAETRLYIEPNTDIMIDISDAHSVKISCLQGETKINLSDQWNPISIPFDHIAHIPMSQSHRKEIEKKEISTEMRQYINSDFTLPKFDSKGDYHIKLQPAISFSKLKNTNWPKDGRSLSGVVCPFCAYAFAEGEPAKTYCPHCYKPLTVRASKAEETEKKAATEPAL